MSGKKSEEAVIKDAFKDIIAEDDKKIGNYSGDMDRKTREPMFSIRFQYDRSFELHVAGKVYHLEPHGSVIVPKSVVEHPDFRQVASYFGISEVKDG